MYAMMLETYSFSTDFDNDHQCVFWDIFYSYIHDNLLIVNLNINKNQLR